MAQNLNRQQFRPRQERGVRQGQATVGKNRDIRVDKMLNGNIGLTQIAYVDTDIAMKPIFYELTQMDAEGFRKFVDLCGDILDSWDKLEGSETIPIDRSEYAERRDERWNNGE